MTRCRQGDLAIVVRSMCGNEGRIVKCIARYDGIFVELNGEIVLINPSWVIEPHLPTITGGRSWAIADENLRPIRDPGDDAIDEIIQRVGKPSDVTLREFEEALDELKRVGRELKELEKQLTQ